NKPGAYTTTSEEWLPAFTATGGVIIAGAGAITMGAAKVFNASVPLTINSSATLATNNFGLTFGGDFVNNSTFTAGSSPIVIAGTATTQSIDGFTTTGLVSMTKTGGTATFQGNVDGAGLTINGIGGTLNLGTGLTHTFTGTWTRTNGTLNGGSSLLRFGGIVSGTGGTFTAGTGTVEWYASGTQIIPALDYSNLTSSSSGDRTLASSGTIGVAGTFTPGTNTYTVTGSTVNFNGTVDQAVTSFTYHNLILSVSGTKTFAGATTINVALSISGTAVANLGTYTSSSNTLTLGGNGQPSGSWGGPTSGATHINSAYFATATGILNVAASGCSAGTWIGSTSTDWHTTSNWCDAAVPTASTNVVIPPGGNQPVIGAAAVCNNMTVNSGATLAITGSNILTVSGNWTNSGTFTANSSTVIFNGAAQTVGTGPYNNLTLAGSGTKTTTGVTVNGILYMEGTATASAAPTYGTSATLQYNTATSRTAGAEWIGTFAATGGVIIANTGAITLNAVKVFNASVPLTINSGATLAMSTFLLTLNGDLINNGGTASGTTGGVTITGTATQSIGAFTTTGTVSMTKTGSTATFQGNVGGAGLTINGTGGTLNLGTVLTHTFSGLWTQTAGTLDGGSSLLRFGGSVGGTGGTFTAGTGTVEWFAAVAQTIPALNYNNLTSSSSGARTLASSGTIGVAGTFTPGTNAYTITGSTVDFNGSGSQTIPAFNYNNLTSSSSGARTLASPGTIGVAGTFTPGTNTYTVTGSTVNFNGTVDQAVTSFTYHNLILSVSGTKTFAGATTINVALSISGTAVANLGTYTSSSNTLTLGGNGQPSGSWGGTGSPATYINTTYFAAATGILNIAASSCTAGAWIGGISTDWNTASNWCEAAVPTASTNVVIPPGGNQPVIGAAAVCNNMTVNSGATLAITGSNILTVSGNWTNSGTFTANSSTVIFNGAAQTVGTGPYNNLTLAGSGTKTTTGVTVNGILYMEGTATASAAPTYGTSATLQYNTATSRTAGAEWIGTFAATGGVIIANTGAITLNAVKVFNASVPLTINSGATLAMSTFLLTLNGDLINNGGTASGTTGGVTITGTATQSIGAFTTTGTVSMTKTGSTATFQGNVGGAGLTINGTGGTLNLGTVLTHTFSGLWTQTAGTLDGGSSLLRFGGSVGGTGGTFTAGTGTVEWFAAVAQTIPALNYNNLIFSGAGAKTLQAASTIGIAGDFTRGTMTVTPGATNTV
ncbi:MAG: hypothetical protein WC605_13010, partial [Bacteroidales bacterium]